MTKMDETNRGLGCLCKAKYILCTSRFAEKENLTAPYTFKTSTFKLSTNICIFAFNTYTYKGWPRTKLNRRSSTQLMWCLRIYTIVVCILLIIYFWWSSRAQNFPTIIPYNFMSADELVFLFPIPKGTKDILFAKFSSHFHFECTIEISSKCVSFAIYISGCGTSNWWTSTMGRAVQAVSAKLVVRSS